MSAGLRALAVPSLVLGAALWLGCGGGNRCEAVGQLICDMACDCTDGDMCVVQSAGATITHDTPADCAGFWVDLGCMQSDQTIHYGACERALDSATCVDTGDGSALGLPAECTDAPSQQALSSGKGAPEEE